MRSSITVIVPVFGDGPHLDTCIARVQAALARIGGGELVVVDNGSEPPVRDRWSGSVQLTSEARPGSYAARMRGVEVSSGEVLAFTDADCLPHEAWLAEGLATLAEHDGWTIVAGRVRLVATERPSVAEHYELRYGFPQESYASEGFGVTANLFVPRALYDEVGGFDPSLRSGGDREFGMRAQSMGAKVVLCDRAFVDHPARATIADLVHKARRTAGGNVQWELRDGSRVTVALASVPLLRPPVRGLARIWCDEAARPVRARLCLLVLALRWIVLLERLRVLATGTPLR